MRVLMTTDTVGGVWTFTRELATHLLQRGCEIALVSFGRSPSPSQQAACDALARSYGPAFRYEPSDAPLEWMQNNEHAYSLGALLLLKLEREWNPELLLTNQFCFGALPLLCSKIVVAHSDVLSWAEACGISPLPSTPWIETYRSLVAQGLDAATAVIAPTRAMLAALSESFKLPPRTYVIPNGRTIASLPSSRKPQAITAGRLWDQAKNLQLLQHVHSPFPLLVAGESVPDSLTPAPGFPSLTLLGPQPEDALLALFRDSSIYLCTSKYEPFGLAPLEAALCGCAVLANDIPSLREVWGEAALYFHDAPSLSSLLAHLHAQPAELRLAQQRSLKRAQAFTAARMADAYQRVFEHLLNQAPNHLRSEANAA